jgi:glycosyltransferase involved in cell wall biosynthesis
MVDSYRAAGAEVILMKLDRSRGLLHLVRKLKNILQQTKPDIVHVQYMAPGFIPIIVARLCGIRTVFATVHQPGRTHGLKAKVLLRTAALFCTAFFCVSQAAETSWFGSSAVFDARKYRKARRKHFTIYNSIDFSSVKERIKKTDRTSLKKSLGLDKCLIVGSVGRFREEKGQGVLIRAMANVVHIFPEACLLLVGDGPDREKLQKLSEELNLHNYIHWVGQLDPEAVIAYYNIMDLAVVPSRFEGFGLAAVEAMAAGLPVLASKVDGLCEVIEHEKTGYLIPPENSNLLADHIIVLLTDLDKAAGMGRAGRKRVEQYFSMEQFSDAILTVYKSYRNS